jgi:isopentenyl-diphosphate Delta-isomerase
MKEYVVLVDKNDRQIGSEEKLKSHKMGLLHRAFSIFIFNPEGNLLLQRRNPEKYHCGNLWSNTCCSHPRPGEQLQEAAHRRLREEMGFDCNLFYLRSFHYIARFENGLIENELDHIFYGTYDGEITINSKEVSEHKWIELHYLDVELESNRREYTPWLKPAINVFPGTIWR